MRQFTLSLTLAVGDAFVPMSATGKPTTEDAADRLKIETTDRHQRTFVFKNRPPDQAYRFQARAYDTQENLISKDADSFSDVTFTRVEVANTPTGLPWASSRSASKLVGSAARPISAWTYRKGAWFLELPSL
ncbi:hypothetical protein D3C72_254660 [compost metagenome]